MEKYIVKFVRKRIATIATTTVEAYHEAHAIQIVAARKGCALVMSANKVIKQPEQAVTSIKLFKVHNN